MSDKVICSTKHFSLKVPNLPHITRNQGGHIFVEANDHSIESRFELTPEEQVELIWFVQISSKAYWDAMRQNGVDLYKLNYQDNGMWAFIRGEKPVFHIHIYGRAECEKDQEYGQALNLPYPDSGFYNDFQPINDEDIELIKRNIKQTLNNESFDEGRYCLISSKITF